MPVDDASYIKVNNLADATKTRMWWKHVYERRRDLIGEVKARIQHEAKAASRVEALEGQNDDK